MDGNEGRSGATALCEGTGDEATASGDAAPTPVTGRPEHDVDTSTAGGSVDAVDAAAAGSTGTDEEPATHDRSDATNADDAAPDVAAPDVAAAVVAADDAPAGDPSADAAEPDGAAVDASADDAEPDGAPADDSAADDSAPDDSAADELVAADSAADDVVADDAVADEDDAPADDAPEPAATTAATRVRRPRSYVRRSVLALVAAGFVALAVGAFALVAPSPERADQQFVDAAQSQGHVVVPGEQQTLVVSAARKICDRRVLNNTDQERRATALTTSEIAAVGTAFGADTRDFTTLALDTYCSS